MINLISISVSFDTMNSKQVVYSNGEGEFPLPCRYCPSVHYEGEILKAMGFSDEENYIHFTTLIITKRDKTLLNFDIEADYEDAEDGINEIVDAFDDYFLTSYDCLEDFPVADLVDQADWLKKQLERSYFIENAINEVAAKLFLKQYPRYDRSGLVSKVADKFSEIYQGSFRSERAAIEELWELEHTNFPSIGGLDTEDYVDWEGLATDLFSQSDYDTVWSEYPDEVRIYVFDLSPLD